jgi:hypothetical protein
MKPISLILILIISSNNTNAQNIDYEKALTVINSDYAKSLFPEKKSQIEIINEIPDTINISDKQTFRLLQYVKKRMECLI